MGDGLTVYDAVIDAIDANEREDGTARTVFVGLDDFYALRDAHPELQHDEASQLELGRYTIISDPNVEGDIRVLPHDLDDLVHEERFEDSPTDAHLEQLLERYEFRTTAAFDGETMPTIIETEGWFEVTATTYEFNYRKIVDEELNVPALANLVRGAVSDLDRDTLPDEWDASVDDNIWTITRTFEPMSCLEPRRIAMRGGTETSLDRFKWQCKTILTEMPNTSKVSPLEGYRSGQPGPECVRCGMKTVTYGRLYLGVP